jgi:hypothetical protein
VRDLHPTPDDLRALVRKYRTLAVVHRALAAWQDERAAELDGELAAEFPGALRELQTLPLDEIERRADALERAASLATAVEPWMVWMHGYHRLLRRALRAKRRLPPDEGDDPFDEAFLHAVAHPPGGRLNRLVLDELARLHDTTAAVVHRALFLRRRGDGDAT